MERKDSWGDEEIDTRIAAAWSKRQDEKERRERSAKRKYEIHLSEADSRELSDTMAANAEAAAASSEEMAAIESMPLVEGDFLAGL